MEHYLDNAATTAVCPEAAEAAVKAMTLFYGNPSSTHAKGREAAKLLSSSRAAVADALGCAAEELVSVRAGISFPRSSSTTRCERVSICWRCRAGRSRA